MIGSQDDVHLPVVAGPVALAGVGDVWRRGRRASATTHVTLGAQGGPVRVDAIGCGGRRDDDPECREGDHHAGREVTPHRSHSRTFALGGADRPPDLYGYQRRPGLGQGSVVPITPLPSVIGALASSAAGVPV
ncbi:Uncharacterised protein [Mycobacteroides abscessus]|nr:Uncharacterised protein [Mycobacteroides abscessus]